MGRDMASQRRRNPSASNHGMREEVSDGGDSQDDWWHGPCPTRRAALDLRRAVADRDGLEQIEASGRRRNCCSRQVVMVMVTDATLTLRSTARVTFGLDSIDRVSMKVVLA